MRAFLTGALIGLTGYTLGIIAARALAKRHDPNGQSLPASMFRTHDFDDSINEPLRPTRFTRLTDNEAMDDWDTEATPTNYMPTPCTCPPHMDGIGRENWPDCPVHSET